MWNDFDDTKLSDLVDTERHEPKLHEETPIWLPREDELDAWSRHVWLA